jgi:hypothetical protein
MACTGGTLASVSDCIKLHLCKSVIINLKSVL